MSNKTDSSKVGNRPSRKQTDRLVVGLLDDQSAVVGMQGDNEVFRIYSSFMQPNHYQGNTALQVFACAKGGRDIEIEMFDEDGNCTGAQVGYFRINCKIDDQYLVDCISDTNDIDISIPKK